MSEEEKEDNLTEDIANAYDELEAKEEEEDGDDTSEQVEETGEEEDEADPDSLEAASEEEDAEAEEDEEISDEESEDDQPAEDEDEEAEDSPEFQPIQPPLSWSAEDRTAFSELPPAIQQTIARRENERDAYLTQTADRVAKAERRYEELDDAFAPYQEEFAMKGETPATVVRRFLAWRENLKRDPVGAMEEIAHSVGTNLQQLTQVQMHRQQHGADPHYMQVMNEVNGLRQQLADRDAQEEDEYNDLLMEDVENFSQAVDEQGNAKYPFFNSVTDDMVPIVQSLRANPQYQNESNEAVLVEAYNRACRANPQVFNLMVQHGEKAKEAERLKRVKKKAAKAKKAAGSLKGSPGGNLAKDKPDTLRAAIESAYDEASAR